jgi:diguanylate cyclase (GGDEF)-like protein
MDAGLTPISQWIVHTPRRVWVAATLAIVACTALILASFSTMTSSSARVERLQAASTVTSDAEVLTNSVKTVTVALESLSTKKEQSSEALAESVGVVETQRTNIDRALDTYVAAGIAESDVEPIRETFDAFIDNSLKALETDVTGDEADEVGDLGKRAGAQTAQLNNLLTTAATNAADSAGRSLMLAKIMLSLIPVIGVGTALFIINALNMRNRTEVMIVARALDEIGRHHETGGLDPQRGPISAALAAPLGVMMNGVKTSMERLEIWARTSDVERYIAESMEAVRSRGDIAGAVGNSFNAISGSMPMELMVLSPDASRMLRVASHPESGASGCPVSSPGYCPAMRSNEPLRFDDALAPEACPQLRARGKPCAAICVPVQTHNNRIGVIHATAASPQELDGNVVAHMKTVADLSAAKLTQVQAFETTWRRATTDQLTALHNRRAFEDRANELLAREIPFILVMADLDHFKRLNDNFGHKVGDEVLKAFARVLRQNIRRSDMAARFGGEEFLVLLPEISMTEAMVTLDRVRLAFGPTLGITGLPKTTASFGATRSNVADNLEEIIRVADSGLYLAKQNGRDRVETADCDTVRAVFGNDGNSPARPGR